MLMGSPLEPPPFRRRDAAPGWLTIAAGVLLLLAASVFLFGWRP